MKFEDLKVAYGYPLQLQTRSAGGQPQRFGCRLVGCLPGQAILVTQPRMEKGPRLRSGQKIVLRMMVANGIGLCACTVESASNTPFPVLYLSYPASVNFKQIRGATRVDVQLPVQAINTSSLNDLQFEGVIADISISGARIEMREPIGEMGDTLSLTASVLIGTLPRSLLAQAVIRSRIERSTREYAENMPAVYGIEFSEDDADKLLVLHAYVYSEMAKTIQPA